MNTEKPTKEQIDAQLIYNAETGLFTRRIDVMAKPWHKAASAGDLAGWKTKKNGWVISVLGKQYKAHHLAWLMTYGFWPKLIDHKDGDRLNNAISNLREVTVGVNTQNMRRAMKTNKSSGMLGVSASRSKLNPWKAQIRIDGAITHLGSFPTKEAAHEAYVAAKRIHHEGCTL
jgi:hypothetical protein